MSVLNYVLYRNLCRTFGEVDVVHQGEPANGYYQTNPQTGNKEFVYLDWGERYLLNCPICDDTRCRAAFCHRYGVVDEVTGRYSKTLWKCYNEECQANYGNCDFLYRKLYSDSFGNKFAAKVPLPKLSASLDLPPVQFPGVIQKVKDLDASHPANEYLLSRKFDPTEMSDVWDVSYCPHAPARCDGAMSSNRLIIPVTLKGALIGWQARFLGEIDFKAMKVPKYLTYFSKSRTLYGLDQLKLTTSDTLALVEGATDCWRYGPGSLSRFGKKLSARQADILIEVGDGKNLAILVDGDDPDAVESALEDYRSLTSKRYQGRIEILPIAKGKDPADISRKRLHSVVSSTFKKGTQNGKEESNSSGQVQT